MALPAAQERVVRAPAHADTLFQTADNCLACHNGLTTASGEDVSIGSAWRASMMANSSRDPYWQAAVRREAMDHPAAVHEIEDECSTCHMPMARTRARAAGGRGEVFRHLTGGAARDGLAADGVSCSVCHQITGERLGTPESFTGGFVIGPSRPGEPRTMFGPFEVDRARTSVMRSATTATPAAARHISESELCATCHTLYTKALGPSGDVIGSLPEQVPYLEWRHSSYRDERSCQSCHMPEVDHPTPIASVLGEPREGLSRHTFLGGNFFMIRMLNRYRGELNVTAMPDELAAAADATVKVLQSDTATLTVSELDVSPERVQLDVTVSNATGHKLPTGYPSRRVWLHVTLRDRDGRTIFESGAVDPRGAIAGNDHDADPAQVEPHYDEIRRPDQVQIYESTMADAAGQPTTGLLRGVSFMKDNRLLPRGFDKQTAAPDISVRGSAAGDVNFTSDGDRVRYVMDVTGARGPFEADVELRYQPVAYRWAQNLRSYDAAETRRFVSFYDAMAGSSSVVLARAASHERSSRPAAPPPH